MGVGGDTISGHTLWIALGATRCKTMISTTVTTITIGGGGCRPRGAPEQSVIAGRSVSRPEVARPTLSVLRLSCASVEAGSTIAGSAEVMPARSTIAVAHATP